MGVNVRVDPYDFLAFLDENVEEAMDSMLLLASNDSVAIYVTIDEDCILLQVEDGGEVIEQFESHGYASQFDYEDLLKDYIYGFHGGTGGCADVADESDLRANEIYTQEELCRANRIEDAAYQFLRVLLEGSDAEELLGTVDCEECAIVVEEWLYAQYKTAVYHPTVYETTNGTWELVHYPAAI